MTNEERDQIILLRCQGLSYEKISKALGLKRDTIRAFCKRNGLNGQAADIKESHKKIVIDEFTYKICLYCGKKLEQKQTGRRKKYCSIECKREWEKGHRKIYILKCEYCGKEYESKGFKNRKYCSHDCYIRDRFWREEDASEIVRKLFERESIPSIPKWVKDLLLKTTDE